MSTTKYLGMRDGDLEGKPYAKYWNPEMKPVPGEILQALAHGPEAAELGFELGEADLLLKPGYLPLENGYTRLANGQVFVATLTQMPGVTYEMIDWWFGWHYMESQRYKLWHPRSHLLNRAQRMIGDDANLSDREKYLSNPNFVSEYIGTDVVDIIITFAEAGEFLDASRFADAGIGTAICGSVGFQKVPLRTGYLIHLIRETKDGCEMRSRFWLGHGAFTGMAETNPVNRFMGSKLVAKNAVQLELGRDMVVHCAMEMNHLAGFLPDLYRDYH